MATTSVEDLRRQLKTKEAELRQVKADLHRAMSSPLSETSSISADGSILDSAVEASPRDDLDSLRKQLNEANARWRWEERRAKAREEELAEAERARTESTKKELEELKAELAQTKEKSREATRKRAQLQADFAAAKVELDELRNANNGLDDKAKALRADLDRMEGRADDAEAKAASLKTANEDLTKRLDALMSEHDTLTAAASERDAAVARATAAEAQLASSEEKVNALKQTMRHNAQLVKDLKAELAKAMPGPGGGVTAPPPPVSSPPAPPAAVDADRTAESERLIQELAIRLEALLKENGTLSERVKFLESIVQSLTAELNSFKDTRDSPVRPPSLRAGVRKPQ
jgi:DNA repair exonuclease SbcCD ATPase subunit